MCVFWESEPLKGWEKIEDFFLNTSVTYTERERERSVTRCLSWLDECEQCPGGFDF